MDTTSVGITSTTGQWVTLAGLIVLVLSHFGINVVPGDIEVVLAGAAALYGIIHSLIAQKNLKTIAGIH